MDIVLDIVGRVIQLYMIIMFLRVLMSWVPMFTNRPLDPYNPVVRVLLAATEPVLSPLRRYLTFGMMDLSPMAAIFGLYILSAVIRGAVA